MAHRPLRHLRRPVPPRPLETARRNPHSPLHQRGRPRPQNLHLRHRLRRPPHRRRLRLHPRTRLPRRHRHQGHVHQGQATPRQGVQGGSQPQRQDPTQRCPGLPRRHRHNQVPTLRPTQTQRQRPRLLTLLSHSRHRLLRGTHRRKTNSPLQKRLSPTCVGEKE